METTTFYLVVCGKNVNTVDDAIAVFDDIAGEVANVDFEYDFDYSYYGREIDEFIFEVFVDTGTTEQAYQVMSEKFEIELPEGVNIYY